MAKELLLTTQSQITLKVSCSLWDYNNGNILRIYKNGDSVVSKCLDVLGTDYIVTANSTKPLLNLWQFNSQDVCKAVRFIIPGTANALAVCPSNTYLAVGIDTKIYIWELCSGKLLAVQQVNYQAITVIKFSNHGGYLLIAGKDGIVVVYNLCDLISYSRRKAQKELGQVEPIYKRNDHSLPINDMSVGKFGAKSRFSTVSSDQSLRVYQLIDGTLLLTLICTKPLTAVILDSPCFNVYVGYNTGEIKVFNLRNPPRSLEQHVDDNNFENNTFYGCKGPIKCMDLNLFNNRLAATSDDKLILIFEIRSRQILQKIEAKGLVTNLRFILTNEQMFAQTTKPQVLLNSLDRTVESNLSNVHIAVLQKDDFNVDDEREAKVCENLSQTVKDLQMEVSKLQKLNADLMFEIKKLKT